MPDSNSTKTVEGQYIAEIKYSTGKTSFEFDPGRPPKNVDVLKYVISRTKCKALG